MEDHSLLLPPATQPALPGVPDPAFFAAESELENKGEFTADRLFQQRPDTYKAAAVLLGKGIGVIRIGRLLSVSPNTVLAIRRREGAAIDIVKQHLADVAHNAATLASEAILEALNHKAKNSPELMSVRDLRDLSVLYGIMIQNGQLLAGQPTARVEVTDLSQPEHDDFNRYLAGLKTIDLATEKNPQKEPARESSSAPGDRPAPSAAGDEQSPVKPPQT